MNYQSAFKTLATETFGQSNTLTVSAALIEFLDRDVAAAVHLSQILYWASRTEDGIFYKRYTEWETELRQSIKKLRSNTARFVDMGIVETKVKRVRVQDSEGKPTNRYGDRAVFYKVDWKKFEEVFLKFIEEKRQKELSKLPPGELSKLPPGELSKLPPGDFPLKTKTTAEITNKDKEHNTMFEPKGSNRTNNLNEPFDDEETQQPSSTEGSNSPSLEDDLPREKKKGKQPSSFDERAAREFADAVRCRRKVQKNSDLRQWANVFRQMREVDEIPKKEIREMIQWYAEHINDEFVPEAFSASTFRQKFADGRFGRAVKRSSNGRCSSDGKRLTRENMWDDPSNVLPGGILRVEIGSDGRQYDGRLLHRIRRRVRERYGNGMPLPKQLEAVLTEEFPEAGKLTPSIIGSVG